VTILPRGVTQPSRLATLANPTVRLGPLVIAFRGATESVRFTMSEAWLPFLLEDAAPADFTLHCRLGPVRAPDGQPQFVAGRTWAIWRRPDGAEDIIWGWGAGSEPFCGLRVDSRFRSAQLVQSARAGLSEVRADAHPLLEFLAVRLLARHDAVLVHASTAIVDGGAFVFVGHSGAGKSTMAALAESCGAIVPTDDRTIVACAGNDVSAWGTPWHGSLVRKSPDGAPLRGLYLLRQGAVDRIDPLPTELAVKELFVRLVQPRVDASEVTGTLATLERVLQRVPMSVLSFRPTPAAFELVATR
jgi:hypothetical protein